MINRSSRHDDTPHDRHPVAPWSSTFLLPVIAAVFAIIALLLLLSAHFGWPGILPTGMGFSLLRFAAYCAFGCGLLSLVTGLIAVHKRHYRSLMLVLVALLAALFALWGAVVLEAKGRASTPYRNGGGTAI